MRCQQDYSSDLRFYLYYACSAPKNLRDHPQAAIAFEFAIGCDDWHAFRERRRDQHAIKWIAVMKRESKNPDSVTRFERNQCKPQILGSF